MAYGTTKELRAIAIGGKTFIQGERTPLSYDEATEFSKDDRLKITISPQEHAANFGRAASEEPQTPTVPEVKMTEAQQIEAIKVDAESIEKAGPELYLGGLQGILIPGGFGDRGTEGKIIAKKPTRGGKRTR